MIVVFESQCHYKNSRGTASAGVLNTRGVGKNCVFRPTSLFILLIVYEIDPKLMW